MNEMWTVSSGVTCDECDAPAVAWYDYGTGQKRACTVHNPFTNLTVNRLPAGGTLCPTCHQPWRFTS